MADKVDGAAGEERGTPPPRNNTYEIEEGRKYTRFWMPRYVVRDFSERIGQRGIAIYASLAWWLTSDAPHHRPTLSEIGRRAGSSRATVWRGLKTLQEVGLIELVPNVGPTGRRAHKIRLVHPPEVGDPSESSGTESAGGSNLSARRAQGERAARSNCARGALNVSAPSLDQNEGSKRESNAPLSPEAAPSPDQERARQVADLQNLWMDLLPVVAEGPRSQHSAEIEAELAELLRQGWTYEQLHATIALKSRVRMEWPRQWREREHPGPPKVARTPPDSAEVAQKRNAQREEAKRCKAELDEIRRKNGGKLFGRHRGAAPAEAVVKDPPPSEPG